MHPVRTTFTVGADTPEAMAARAVKYADAKSIKVKLTGELDLDLARVRAIRAARPDVWLGVDGNQGFRSANCRRWSADSASNACSLLEQPLPRGREADLEGFDSPIPIAATKACCRSTTCRAPSAASTSSTSSSTSAAASPKAC